MIVQRSRYVLKSRVTRARRCPLPLFQPACVHLIDWLENHALFAPMVARLKLAGAEQFAALAGVVQQILNPTGGNIMPGRMKSATLEEHAASCLAVVHTLARANV